MSGASLRVLLAGAALVAGLGAAPGPRGVPPKADYPVSDTPRPSREERAQDRKARRMGQNELIKLQRGRALDTAEALEKLTNREEKLSELGAWTQRIVGRFRLEGEVSVPWRIGAPVVTKVSGIADCAGIGEGAGVQCVFNATWPILDPRPIFFGASAMPRWSADALRAFNPAILVLGIDPRLFEVKAMLVTDDTFTHVWAGLLKGNTLTAGRLAGCAEPSAAYRPDDRCITTMEVIAEPDSEVVTLQFRAPANIRIEMRREAGAQPKKPMKAG